MSKLPEFKRVDHFEQQEPESNAGRVLLTYIFIMLGGFIVFVCVVEYAVKQRADEIMVTHTPEDLWNIIQISMDLDGDMIVSKDECRIVYEYRALNKDWVCNTGVFKYCSTASDKSTITKEDILNNPRCVDDRMIISFAYHY